MVVMAAGKNARNSRYLADVYRLLRHRSDLYDVGEHLPRGAKRRKGGRCGFDRRFVFRGLALGRFTSGLFAKKLSSWRLIYIGCALLLSAIVLLVLPFRSVALSCVGLFLTGFGIGPIYPNLTHLTPVNFGEENAQSVIGSQMAMAYVGILFAPLLFGFLAQGIGLVIFPYALAVMFALFIYALIRIVTVLKKQEKYHPKELE